MTARSEYKTIVKAILAAGEQKADFRKKKRALREERELRTKKSPKGLLQMATHTYKLGGTIPGSPKRQVAIATCEEKRGKNCGRSNEPYTPCERYLTPHSI